MSLELATIVVVFVFGDVDVVGGVVVVFMNILMKKRRFRHIDG